MSPLCPYDYRAFIFLNTTSLLQNKIHFLVKNCSFIISDIMKKQPCLSSIYCFSAWIYFWLISILRIFFHSHAILLRIRFNLLHDLLLVCFFLFCFFVISDIGHLWKCAALGQLPSAFLYECGIQSMQQLHEKISDMNSRYYDLRGKIVKAERDRRPHRARGDVGTVQQVQAHPQTACQVKTGEAGTVRAAPQPGTDPLRRGGPVSERIEGQRRGNHPQSMVARNRPAGRRKAGGHHRHEGHAGGTESSGTTPQGRRPSGPAGTGQVP